MQNTSKPGGRPPTVEAVRICAADKVRASVSPQNTPGVTNERHGNHQTDTVWRRFLGL